MLSSIRTYSLATENKEARYLWCISLDVTCQGNEVVMTVTAGDCSWCGAAPQDTRWKRLLMRHLYKKLQNVCKNKIITGQFLSLSCTDNLIASVTDPRCLSLHLLRPQRQLPLFVHTWRRGAVQGVRPLASLLLQRQSQLLQRRRLLLLFGALPLLCLATFQRLTDAGSQPVLLLLLLQQQFLYGLLLNKLLIAFLQEPTLLVFV